MASSDPFAQEYINATNAFGMDPELRNLLMATMDRAAQGTQPEPIAPDEQFRMTAGLIPPQAMSMAGQQSNVAAKGDMLSPAPGTPPPAPLGVPPYSPMRQFGPTAAVPSGQSAPTPAAASPGAPPAVRAAGMGGVPAVNQPSKLTAFLQGLGSSDAILPAIGGGMAAVENLERAGQVRNQTVRALMSRGLDAETAAAAANNPEILKAVLPGLFGSNSERSVGSDYDPNTGQERKFFYNQKGPANIEYIGGTKRDASQNAITAATGKANLKRVEAYKSQADQAREMMGSLNQLKELRTQVPDALKGLPGGLGGTVAGWTDYFGVTDGAKALSPQELEIQLGFTAKTKGAITDREMSLFAGGVPGFGMTDEAANKVIAGMEATAQRKIEQAKFFEAWFAANKGSLEGAQDSWDAYINANPVIVRNPDGTLAVNTKNVGNWKDYVTSDGQDPRTNFGPSPGTSAIEGSGVSGPERRMDRPAVTTPEDYDALQPGDVYLDPNGNERRKR